MPLRSVGDAGNYAEIGDIICERKDTAKPRRVISKEINANGSLAWLKTERADGTTKGTTDISPKTLRRYRIIELQPQKIHHQILPSGVEISYTTPGSDDPGTWVEESTPETWVEESTPEKPPPFEDPQIFSKQEAELVMKKSGKKKFSLKKIFGK